MEIVFVRHAEKKEGDGDLGLSEKGIKQAQKYSWQRMATQTLEVYTQVLGDSD